jgi:hypothetical protein
VKTFSMVLALAVAAPDGGIALDEERPTRVIVLPEGVATPADGCWMDKPDCILMGQRRVATDMELAMYRQRPQLPGWTILIGVVLAAGVGGFALGWVLKPAPALNSP